MTHTTPGPWRVSGKNIIAVDHGKYFKVAGADGANHTLEANIANAHLIAAAPDMLEALEGVLADFFYNGECVTLSKIKDCQRAIATAKGEDQ